MAVGAYAPSSYASAARRRFPVGVEVVGDGAAHVRVWAPAAQTLSVLLSAGEHPLERGDNGYFSGLIAARAGDAYRFRLDDADAVYPDPASRFQPNGPHGASQIVNPAAYRWTDTAWAGVHLPGQ